MRNMEGKRTPSISCCVVTEVSFPKSVPAQVNQVR